MTERNTAKVIADLLHRVSVLENQATGVRHVDLAIRKFVSNNTARTIEGIASTADLDRMGDIVNPTGMRVKLPVPLLFGHDHDAIIGSVSQANATDSGVFIRAQVVTGTPKADEAWTLIQQGALTSFSIGFIGLERTPIKSGWRFDSWELLEISAVAVPANPAARITANNGAKDNRGSIKLVMSPTEVRRTGAIPLRVQ